MSSAARIPLKLISSSKKGGCMHWLKKIWNWLFHPSKKEREYIDDEGRMW